MKISELPQEIREKALEYQKNETSEGYYKTTDNLFYAFSWRKTIEGNDYWQGVYAGKIPQQPIHYDNSNNREQQFEAIIANTIHELQELLLIKGKEYRRDNNPYHNFEIGSIIEQKTREEVLQGFLLKHLISVKDMRNDLKQGIFPTENKVNEKYNDILIYFMIEKAMMIENCKETKCES